MIGKDEQNQNQLYENPDALGNAWSVDSLLVFNNPDQLLSKLKDTDISKLALGLENTIPKDLPQSFNSKDLIKIEKIKNSSSNLIYNYNSLSEQLIVFSEIYYPEGWTAKVNGKEMPIQKVNYLLRGLDLPKGKYSPMYGLDKAEMAGLKVINVRLPK